MFGSTKNEQQRLAHGRRPLSLCGSPGCASSSLRPGAVVSPLMAYLRRLLRAARVALVPTLDAPPTPDFGSHRVTVARRLGASKQRVWEVLSDWEAPYVNLSNTGPFAGAVCLTLCAQHAALPQAFASLQYNDTRATARRCLDRCPHPAPRVTWSASPLVSQRSPASVKVRLQRRVCDQSRRRATPRRHGIVLSAHAPPRACGMRSRQDDVGVPKVRAVLEV